MERPTAYVEQDALKIWTGIPDVTAELTIPTELVDGLSSTLTFAGEAAGTLTYAVMEAPAVVLPDDTWGRTAILQDPWEMAAKTVLNDVPLPLLGDDVPWLAEYRPPVRTSSVPGSLDQLLSAAHSVDDAVTAFSEHFTARQRVRANPDLDEQVETLVNALQRGARLLSSLRAS